MENRDDSENNAKVSDSAYSNSCSNSQSRRSHSCRSSKSTLSGSNCSGSSGYGGKQSTSTSSNNLEQALKKEKEPKKKKQIQTEATVPDVMMDIEMRPPEAFVMRPPETFVLPLEDLHDKVVPLPASVHMQIEQGVENMDIVMDSESIEKEVLPLANLPVDFLPVQSASLSSLDGFACVVSLHDGIVLYTTPSLTTVLGFPKDVWVGRSFLQFMFSKDHKAFTAHIANALVRRKIVNAQPTINCSPIVACRLRRYKSLLSGFNVRDKSLKFQAFILNLSLKNINNEDDKIIYLVMQVTPLYSAFKIPHERINKATPFVIKHTANGTIDYIDPEAIPYLGFLPQDLIDTNALLLYHPDDLNYLCHVYETVVKEGSMKRSKSYRIKIENGNYLKVETEWSTFICPWSRNVIFITGKHYVIEGPLNPDVFANITENKPVKTVEDDKTDTQMLRDKIIRIMNEVPSLTKPAEVIKQQISKRCHDLASFMETLMEEQPKIDEELHLDIQEPDHNYFERDSVILGGISPHHDFNDSKSSTETPLSYTQLNYNETLQRYFESHHPYSYEEFKILANEKMLEYQDKTSTVMDYSYVPKVPNSESTGEMSRSSDVDALPADSSAQAGVYQSIRLTESSLTKHNSEMEKELMKCHRVTRSNSKGERDKTTNENRQKKKEHLARCNATFQPTTTPIMSTETQVTEKPHGVKRASKHEDNGTHKQLCSATRQSQRRQHTNSTNVTTTPLTSAVNTTVAATHWTSPAVNNMGTFILGVGIPQQMPIMSPVPAMPGIFPMYYAPVSTAPEMPVSTNGLEQPTTSAPLFQAPAMPCMMYGQPMYGSPFMYSPMNPQVSYSAHQALMAQSLQYNTMNPLGLTSQNYEEACKTSTMLKTAKMGGGWRGKLHASTESKSAKTKVESADSNTSAQALTVSTDAGNNRVNRLENKDEPNDKTDGDSSHSSFYSSFFKTESGSAEESGDAKKAQVFRCPLDVSAKYFEPQNVKKVARRKMEPPWMDQLCVTSDLIYKYQILTKSMEEVLIEDKQKMSSVQQPVLVNEQLSQLYMDLQLEGVAARLTLEEGVTSSSSSGEETSAKLGKALRKKREYSKLVMIYEEDAPLPPADEETAKSEATEAASTSTCDK